MRKWLWRGMGVLLTLLLAALTFVFGGIRGFGEGYTYQLSGWAANEAAITVNALKAIRRGDVSSAVTTLESQLDMRISEVYSAQEAPPLMITPWFTPEPDHAQIARFMKPVATYRHEHPSRDEFVQRYLSTKYGSK